MTNATRLGITYPALVALGLLSGCGDGGAGPSKPSPAGSAADGGAGAGGSGGAGGDGAGGGGGEGGSADAGQPDAPGQAAAPAGPAAGRVVGQTEFVTEVRTDGVAPPGSSAPPPPVDSSIRIPGEMEADMYHLEGDHLFYLSTHRGFIAFDVADSARPQELARISLSGTPVELFASGKTLFVVVRNAVRVTRQAGAIELAQRHFSQLVAIDVTDPRSPRVVKTVDVAGTVRAGLSRKIGDFLFLVSDHLDPELAWVLSSDVRYLGRDARSEQAWIHSFDLRDPAALTEAARLQIYEGGTVDFMEGGASFRRRFQSVNLDATADAVLAVENWELSSSISGGCGADGCGPFPSHRQAVVSVMDLGGGDGAIRRHTRFVTGGESRWQFRLSQHVREPGGQRTFYGIFAQACAVGSCQDEARPGNSFESWDVTDGETPVRLDRLDLGKAGDSVVGTAYDVPRRLLHAITYQAGGPLRVIDLANPKDLRLRSTLDGVGGFTSLLRPIAGGQFLLTAEDLRDHIGGDMLQLAGCPRGPDATGRRSLTTVVRIIDVRDASNPRRVQHRCLALKDAGWLEEETNRGIYQVHRSMAVHEDGPGGLITLPVRYHLLGPAGGHRRQTAVAIMSWDLSRYDESKGEDEQSVIQNHGALEDRAGHVGRGVIVNHQAAGAPRRLLLSLSELHLSLADLADLEAPQLQSAISVAPFHDQVYRFGDHLVVRLQAGPRFHEGPAEFRVFPVGADSERATPVTVFAAEHVRDVIHHGSNLVLLRTVREDVADPTSPSTTEATVYDLRDPTQPRVSGRVTMPVADSLDPSYCGQGIPAISFIEGPVATEKALVFTTYPGSFGGDPPALHLFSLDLSDPEAPRVNHSRARLWEWFTDLSYKLVADPVLPNSVFLTGAQKIATVMREGRFQEIYRDYARRFTLLPDGTFKPEEEVNLPGRLLRTWATATGERLYLTMESRSPSFPGGPTDRQDWLLLLRATNLAGHPVAELRALQGFSDFHLTALVMDGDRLFASLAHTWRPRSGDEPEEIRSDRLAIVDLSALSFAPRFDGPTGLPVRIAGTHRGRLLLGAPGGLVIIDARDPAKPIGQTFLRAHDEATHFELTGDDLHVAAGHFGLRRARLDAAPDLPAM